MKVLMLHNDYRQIGGETRSVQAEHKLLVDFGINCHLVLEPPLDRVSVPTSLNSFATGSSSRQSISSIIETFAPDLIHVQNLWPSLGFGALRAITESNIPYVQTLRNYRWSCLSANHFRDGSDCNLCNSASTAISGIRHKCFRGSSVMSAAVMLQDQRLRTIRKRTPPQRLIFLSKSMEETALRIPAYSLGRTTVRYNSLDTDPAVGQGGPQVILAGRLEEEKGVVEALEAWDLWRKLPLVVIGDGALANRVADMQRANPGQVSWIRNIPQPEVLTQLAKSTFSISVPRWEEPFGRGALESIAVATPVLYSLRGAIPEVVGEAGVSTGHEPNEMARAMDALLANSDRLRAIARNRYESLFSVSVATKSLVQIYNDVLAD